MPITVTYGGDVGGLLDLVARRPGPPQGGGGSGGGGGSRGTGGGGGGDDPRLELQQNALDAAEAAQERAHQMQAERDQRLNEYQSSRDETLSDYQQQRDELLLGHHTQLAELGNRFHVDAAALANRNQREAHQQSVADQTQAFLLHQGAPLTPIEMGTMQQLENARSNVMNQSWLGELDKDGANQALQEINARLMPLQQRQQRADATAQQQALDARRMDIGNRIIEGPNTFSPPRTYPEGHPQAGQPMVYPQGHPFAGQAMAQEPRRWFLNHSGDITPMLDPEHERLGVFNPQQAASDFMRANPNPNSANRVAYMQEVKDAVEQMRQMHSNVLQSIRNPGQLQPGQAIGQLRSSFGEMMAEIRSMNDNPNSHPEWVSATGRVGTVGRANMYRELAAVEEMLRQPNPPVQSILARVATWPQPMQARFGIRPQAEPTRMAPGSFGGYTQPGQGVQGGAGMPGGIQELLDPRGGAFGLPPGGGQPGPQPQIGFPGQAARMIGQAGGPGVLGGLGQMAEPIKEIDAEDQIRTIQHTLPLYRLGAQQHETVRRDLANLRLLLASRQLSELSGGDRRQVREILDRLPPTIRAQIQLR